MNIRAPLVRIGFIGKRECWSLTLRGWITLVSLIVITLISGVRLIYPFLAVNRLENAELLVFEGWLPDYSIDDVKSEFERGQYKLLIATGGPIIKGEIFSEFKTSAELSAAALRKSGFDEKRLVAVPNTEAFRDRTYASAVALKEWLAHSGLKASSINVFSRGAHARRSRLLFETAFQGQLKVGIIAGKDLRYDGKHWWKTSEGVRDIIDESIAYLYARFLFYPRQESQP